jgi:hypothetical protein
MINEQMLASLLSASKIVDAVAEVLDTRQEQCDCCGRHNRVNWAEYQAEQELRAISNKLKRFSRMQTWKASNNGEPNTPKGVEETKINP